MKKYALLLTTRNKVKYTGDAVRSMFMQAGPSLELLLSDSGSTDGTRELLDQLASSYTGHHTVRRLNCPCAGDPGMVGLNAHINWCMTQTDADVVMQLSGDDYDLAQRSELTIQAYEEHAPSMVLGGMYYVGEDMKYLGETPNPSEDGFCKLEDIFTKAIGGSTCQSWTHEFFDLIGGVKGVGSPDVVMPFLAVLDKGAYYIHKRHHAYRRCISPQNTGLEGVYYSYPEGAIERVQVEELMHFQVTAGHYATLAKMYNLNLSEEVREKATQILASAILDRNASWVNVRQKMSLEGIPPIPFKA